jgi:hypothetical protein
MDIKASLIDRQLCTMLGDHPVGSHQDQIGDGDAREVDGEGVHPIVVWENWILHSNVA